MGAGPAGIAVGREVPDTLAIAAPGAWFLSSYAVLTATAPRSPSSDEPYTRHGLRR